MLYIPFDEAASTMKGIMEKNGFDTETAALLADVFARNTLEGVVSHGINRFPRFMGNVARGEVKAAEKPEKVSGLGGLEVWDGHLAAGPLIATKAMDRACELAKTNGVACVAVRNSNHWMRPGRYGFQAVNHGMIGILWTNTCRNLPAWGATDAHLGNNPFIMGIPREKGPVVIDLSMGQYAYGKLEIAKLDGKRLPIIGGYDKEGNLTDDPAAILESNRILPMGYWKGTAMSLALDMIAAGLSMGRTVEAIGRPDQGESGLSQVFMAINYEGVVGKEAAQQRFDEAVDALLSSTPVDPEHPVRYPGQNVAKVAAKNMETGLPIHEETWATITAMA